MLAAYFPPSRFSFRLPKSNRRVYSLPATSAPGFDSDSFRHERAHCRLGKGASEPRGFCATVRQCILTARWISPSRIILQENLTLSADCFLSFDLVGQPSCQQSGKMTRAGGRCSWIETSGGLEMEGRRSAVSGLMFLVLSVAAPLMSKDGKLALRVTPNQAYVFIDGIAQRNGGGRFKLSPGEDRKSTRLNSSHSQISYAVFCLKKKKE